MARLFSASGDAVSQGTTAIPATGTMFCWHYPISYGTSQNTLRVRNQAAADALLGLFDFFCYTSGTGAMYCGWYNPGSTDHRIQVTYSGNLTTNAWNALQLDWSGSATEAFVGGVSKASRGATSTWSTSGVTRTIGNDAFSTGDHAGGRIAEWALWSAVLDAGERAALAAGVSPLMIRPQSLTDYLPLIGRTGPEPNRTSGTAGTLTGTSQAEHPRVYLPGRRSRTVFTGGGGTTSGTLTATGTATTSLVGAATASGGLTATGSATTSLAGRATATGTFSATGAATTSLVGRATAAGTLSATGSATTSLTGRAAAAGVLSATGSATTSLVGAAQAAGVLTATGAATSSLAGAASATGVLSATGTATTSLAGRALASGVLSATGAATTSLVGQGSASGQGTLSATGAATTSLIGRAAASGRLAATAGATTSLVGSGGATTGDTNLYFFLAM